MPVKAPFIKANSKSGEESGTIYISSEGDYFAEPEIDADLIRDLKSNIYMAGIIRKEILLVFSDKYTIEIKDKAGEVDEDLGKTITSMCDATDVKLWPAMQKAYADIFTYGPAMFNPVWGYEGTDYILKKLRHLPAYTFKDAPCTDYSTQGEILQGIVLNDKNEIEYHQVDNDGIMQKLENIFAVKDPTASEIAGKSIILPLIPVIAMIKFSLKKQMQQVNRIGAKILFLKITSPQEASDLNGNVSDVAYGTELIQKWGTDTSFILRENMEVIDLKLKDDASNLEVIDVLHATLIDFISPSSLIVGKGGLVGSSDKHREQVRSNYVEGIHTWLESAFEILLQQYLDYNDYEGYTVKINIPVSGIDKSDIKAKQAELLSKTRSGHINEIRALLGQPELDEEGLEELKAEVDSFSPPSGGGGMFEEGAQFDTTQTVKQVEKTLEEKLEDIADELSKDVIKAISNE
jgi:hypothetical protein